MQLRTWRRRRVGCCASECHFHAGIARRNQSFRPVCAVSVPTGPYDGRAGQRLRSRTGVVGIDDDPDLDDLTARDVEVGDSGDPPGVRHDQSGPAIGRPRAPASGRARAVPASVPCRPVEERRRVRRQRRGEPIGVLCRAGLAHRVHLSVSSRTAPDVGGRARRHPEDVIEDERGPLRATGQEHIDVGAGRRGGGGGRRVGLRMEGVPRRPLRIGRPSDATAANAAAPHEAHQYARWA